MRLPAHCFRWLCTLLCFTLLLSARAQNVSRAEWFVDTDPGFGNGVAVNITPGLDVTVNFQFDISPYTDGFHNLYVRSYVPPYQVVEDGVTVTKGGWSLTHARMFYKEAFAAAGLPNVVAGEYFIDTDPGVGAGQPIAVSPGTDITNLNFSFDVTDLTPGFHALYVRFRDAAGRWSHSNVRNFYKEDLSLGQTTLPNVVAGEYFIDSDPGIGSGTFVPVTAGTNVNNVSFTFDLTSLTPGFHQVYVRFKDANGQWSHTHVRQFYKEELGTSNSTLHNIVAGEYFIDADPGHGAGVAIPVSAATNISAGSFIADVTGVSAGFHTLSTRFKNAAGQWSHANHRSFYKEDLTAATQTLPDLVALEYFVDTDPGFGQGSPVPLNPATDISAFAFPIDMTNVSIGNHKIYVRALTADGRWSLVHSGSFVVEPPAAIYITIGTIAQQACAGTAFDIPFAVNMPYGSNNVFTAQLSNSSGSFANPVNIGTLTGNQSDTINATIPANTAAGNGYRVRILASSPLDTSAASSTSIIIRRLPEQWLSISGKSQTCIGPESYTLNNQQPNVAYTWSVTSGGSLDTSGSPAVITWNDAGPQSITVTPANSCGNGQPVVLNVMVYSQPPALVPTISQNTRNLYASNPGSNTVNGYQWYRNDTLLAGATGSYYYAATDATYKVAYTNSCGIGAPSAPVTVSTLIVQTVSFDSIPNKVFGDAPFTVTATASSGLGITFSIISGPASVNGATVTLHGVGTIVIRATQAGNNTYAPASADRSFVVTAPPAPDLTVLNVAAAQGIIAPGDSVLINWDVRNIGNAAYPGSWSERVYMQTPGGGNRTLLRQLTATNTSLDTAQTTARNTSVLIPQQFSIGDSGVFVVEVVPASAVQELVGGLANNTGVQLSPWAVKKMLKISPSFTQLSEGGSPVSFTVSRTASLASPLLVTLVLQQPGRFTVPSAVTIPAGQASASFSISAPENSAIEGLQRDTLRLTAIDFASAIAPISITDNDNPTLTISNLSTQAMEGDTVRFRIATNLVSPGPLTVYLTSSNSARFPVPPSVVIPAGVLFIDTAVVLQQDAIPEIDIVVTLNAGAAGHNPAVGTIQIKDNDLPNLQLVIATSLVSEGAGPTAVQATLKRLDTANNVAFTANLSANLPNNLLLPASISLGANEDQKTFTIGVIDNQLAEGDRNVVVTAALFVNSCGCSAPATSSGFVTDTLLVSDNDGAALTVSAPQLALAEGTVFPTALRITRNTPTTNPLTVTLTSSDTTEATVPASITIPAGQAFVNVPVTTIADGSSDGNQQVYFTAAATGFSAGSVWVMVTDLNKPDLQVTAVSVGSNSVQALGLFHYNVAVRNSGFATAPAGVVVKSWLSKDTVLDNTDTLLIADTIRVAIPVGQAVPVINAVVAPDMPGNYYLLFKANPDLTLTELIATNNTSRPTAFAIQPAYTVTASVALPYFKRGTAIPVTGLATNSDGSMAKNKPVEVYIITNGLRRTVSATTDASGAYATHFTPLAGEAGYYTLGASFPGLGQTAAQDSFNILGVKVNSGNIAQFRVTLGDTLRGALSVQNLSLQSLTNFTLAPQTLPNGAVMVFDTIANLNGNTTANINYKVAGTSVSAGSNFLVAGLQAVSTQGIIQPVDVFYYCQAPGAYLSADITSINATVSSTAGQRLIEFRLVNKGQGASGTVSLSLPNVPWLVAMTPTAIPSMAPGDTAVVVLKFLAHTSVPFSYPINGNIVISAQNGNAISLPFTYTKTAANKGVVKATVTNQFTYYTAGEPKVAGALVKIKNLFSGAVYAEGYTDSSGVFMADSIPEGQHRITVEKDKHQSYSGTVTIIPADTVKPVIFINYQAITFSWNVVPTAVQDQYNITLTTQFETHVPVPVVTIDMPKTMPALSGNDTYPFNVTLTNHGLITAKDVALNLPTNDPEYEFVTNYVPADLLAQQSIQVPVVMRRRGSSTGGRTGIDVAAISQFLGINPGQYAGLRTQSSNCQDFTSVVYWYKCNLSSGQWEQGGVLFTYEGRTCTGSGGNGGGIGTWPGYGGGGGGGGYPVCASCPSIPTVSVGPTPPKDDEKKNCVDCLKALYEALKECLVDVPPPLDCGVETYLDQGGAMDYAECLVKSQLPSLDDVVDEIADKIPWLNKLLCLKAVLEAIADCLKSMEGGRLNPLIVNAKSANGSSSLMQTFKSKLQMVADHYQRRVNWITEYYGGLPDYNAWPQLYSQLQPHLDSLDTIPSALQSSALASMNGFDIPAPEIQAFFQRWNLSIQARDAGVLSPTSQYPNIINWLNVKRWSDSMVISHNYAVANGFENMQDMHADTRAELDTFLQMQMNAVCAKVTVQFSQQLTMTREAFDGTLDIFNGHPTDKMDSLSVVMQITDAAGVPSNGLFEIQTGNLTGLANITGTGQINAQQHGIVKFLFIPELGAAPTVPKEYNFGGYVRYWDPYVSAMVQMPLSPVTLTVNPSPNLMLHYFMQRNIMGDDALTTPQIEPSEPAELAVMVENHGYGPAVNMMISSAQPEIVENEKGLAINFNLIGSAFQGQPTNFGLLNINFGTIPALQTRIGQWWFTSSLLGKFVSYEADVVHANSFGNPDLSLVKGVAIHELTKSIRAYHTGEDTLNDFLVNDMFDVADRPDIIYFSQGKRTSPVYAATGGAFSSAVGAPAFTNTLTVTASDTGWNYIKLPDPGDRNYELVSVTRSDGQVIPLRNAWLTYVTLPVSQPPVYENKFHLVDSFSSINPVSYTVVWKPRSLHVPEVVRIEGVPTGVSTVQVQKLRVVFNKAIDSASFAADDMTLTLQGGANIMNNSIVITRVDTATFDVDLSALTTGNGFYNFTVQAANVKDVYGINGATGKNITWTQFLNVPAVQAFMGVNAAAVATQYDTIRVLFNIPVDVSTVTQASFIITKNGVVQSGALTIDSVRSDNKLFYLSGLGAILTQSGEYQFTVDLPNIQSATGVSGLQQQSITLKLDVGGPVIVSSSASTAGGIDPQHVPFVNFEFNEEVVGFNTASVSLTHNGQPVSLNIAQLANQGWKHWTAGDFGMATYPDGVYVFTINLATVKDAAGNFGSGTHQITWTVNRVVLITVSNLSVSPDRGFSSTDAVSHGTNLTTNFTLSANASQVTVSQVDVGGEVVLTTLQNLAAGNHAIPVGLLADGNTGIKITAIGAIGGSASAQLSLYLDPIPLTANWLQPATQVRLSQLDTVQLKASEKLLADTAVKAALTFTRNGFALSTAGVQVQKLNDTVYQVYNLRQPADSTGSFALSINTQLLQKYRSGKPGVAEEAISWIVKATNQVPIARAGRDTVLTTTGQFSLNGLASSDADGDVIRYSWVAPPGVVLSDSTSGSPSFLVDSASHGKIYSFLLVVSDGIGFSTDVVTVSVRLFACRTEVCNGIDDDCDGEIDEDLPTVFYRDVDGDGFGNAQDSVVGTACTVPNGYAEQAGDCNDLNDTIYPGSGGNECTTCGVESVTFAARINNGFSYQWQADSGNGYENLQNGAIYKGTETKYLTLVNAPTSWTGRKLRCVVTKGGTVSYSPEYVLRFIYTWKGTVSSNWEDPANWSCNRLPDEYIDVIVPQLPPLILNQNAQVRTIKLQEGAHLTIKGTAVLEVKK
jgi:hypothetical protein